MQIEIEVVYRIQSHRSISFEREEMSQISPRIISAGVTVTFRIKRSPVCLNSSLLILEFTPACEQCSSAHSGWAWHSRTYQTRLNSFQDVAQLTYPHKISGVYFQGAGARWNDHPVHIFFRLSNAESSHSIPIEPYPMSSSIFFFRSSS